MSEQGKPRIVITYCTQCQWLLRAGWMAQELLSTFGPELGEVALVPGHRRRLHHHLPGRADLGAQARRRFPRCRPPQQLVRDVIDPERDLGHSDRKPQG